MTSLTSTSVFTISCLSIEPPPPPHRFGKFSSTAWWKALQSLYCTIHRLFVLFVDYSRTIRTIRRLFVDYSYYSSTIRGLFALFVDYSRTIIIIIIIIMNYISTRYNFTYSKINYVQDIKRKNGDLPTGRAHTSRNKK